MSKMFSNNVGDKKAQRAYTVDDEIRIVLIGKTGVGKSETGNSIIGRDEFESGGFGDSVTKICKMKETIRGDKKIIVVDTPGLFENGQPIEETKTEVKKCLAITAPGVHCFLLVVQAARFSDEDKKTLEEILQMFGENVHRYAIVLFTKVDQLNVKDSDENNFQKYLNRIPLILGEFLLKVDQRLLFINNTADKEKREDQVSTLFKMIQQTVRKNGGKCYTNAMYEKIERKIQEEMERVQVIKENKEREEIEETRQKIIKETLEKHRKENEEKLRQIEKQQKEEIKRQEEKYRREMKEHEEEKKRREEEYKRKMKEEQQQEKKRQEEEFKRQMKEKQEKLQQSYEEEKKRQEENYRRKLKEELAKERKRQEEEYSKKMEEEQEKEKKRQAEQKNEEERNKREEENRRKLRKDVQKGEMTFLEAIFDWFWGLFFKKKEKKEKSKPSSNNHNSTSWGNLLFVF